MHKPTLILLLLACFALLSLVAAQSQCGPGAGSCSEGNCCSRDGFCGNSELHCGTGCQVGFGACAGSGSSSTVDPSATTASYIPSATASSEVVSPTVSSIVTSTVISTTTTTTTSSTTSTSSSTKGTYQLQPTGRPSGATPSQDNGVRSTVALVVVFIAGMMMV